MAITLRGGGTSLHPRLDRVVQFDERSRMFPVRTAIAASARPRSWSWPVQTILDQGEEGACVGFSICHELNAPPVMVPISEALATATYELARRMDSLPGENYPGTSLLAGMKAAVAMGFYGEYRWAFSEDELLLAVGHKGPTVLGCNWYEGMFEPRRNGFIEPTGQLLGGHAICIEGVSLVEDAYHLPNSWGPTWGIRGRCKIKRAHLRRLLRENGEACIPVQRWRPRTL